MLLHNKTKYASRMSTCFPRLHLVVLFAWFDIWVLFTMLVAHLFAMLIALLFVYFMVWSNEVYARHRTSF